MFLETDVKNYLLSFVLLTLCLTCMIDLVGQEKKDIPIYASNPTYLNFEDINYKKSNQSKFKTEYRLLQNSSVYRFNNNAYMDNAELQNNKSDVTREIKSKNIVGKYLYAPTKEEIPNVLQLYSSQDSIEANRTNLGPTLIKKFRVILDKNDRAYFTDGSLLISFETNVNYSAFASQYNLMLKKEYIDLNMGVYVHNDFTTLENKISFLKEINSVTDVKYNVINPYIYPE
ncbi:MAG: hypothetical protein ACJ0FX_00650 [Gammaproteobacteria bacterium]